MSAPSSCLSSVLWLLQVCACKGEGEGNEEVGQGMPIEWPWELAMLTLLIVLSTLFVWEASGAPCRKRREPTPQVRAVSIKERRAKKLQDRVAAAIDSAVSESPTGDEGRPAPRKGRNKCPSEVTGAESGTGASPTVVYGGINMHLATAREPREFLDQATAAASSTTATAYPGVPTPRLGPTESVEHFRVEPPRTRGGPNAGRVATCTQATQTSPVVVLNPEDSVHVSGGGECIHVCRNCRGLRNAGSVKQKAICQYCVRNQKVEFT